MVYDRCAVVVCGENESAFIEMWYEGFEFSKAYVKIYL